MIRLISERAHTHAPRAHTHSEYYSLSHTHAHTPYQEPGTHTLSLVHRSHDATIETLDETLGDLGAFEVFA